MSARRRMDERGGVLVETPFAVCIILMLVLGVATLVQVAWADLTLSSAVRDAARYATRVEYVPGSGSSARHRTAEQVQDWTAEVAAEVGVEPSDVEVVGYHDDAETPLDQLTAGDQITVTITKRVTNPLYRLAASVTNIATHVVGAGDVFDPTGVGISAAASTYVE